MSREEFESAMRAERPTGAPPGEQAFTGILRPDRDGLAVLNRALIESGEVDESTANMLVDRLANRPLLCWFVLRQIRKEAAAAGYQVPQQGRVDWEALGEFIKTIAPVILEILMLFL